VRRQDRIPEVYFYEWSVNRWRTSETRAILSLAGRGLYRELLDLCYAQGSISSDFQILAAQVGCAPTEIEQIWPKIKRHFYADKHDPQRLRNHASDMYRKQFFEYISVQKDKGRVGGLQKSIKMKDMSSSGLSLVETSIDKYSRDESVLQNPPIKTAAEVAEQFLSDYPSANLPGKPDAVIVAKCLAAAHGDVDLLGRALREMWIKGKKPATSWAWFPSVIPQYCNGAK